MQNIRKELVHSPALTLSYTERTYILNTDAGNMHNSLALLIEQPGFATKIGRIFFTVRGQGQSNLRQHKNKRHQNNLFDVDARTVSSKCIPQNSSGPGSENMGVATRRCD